MHAIQAMSQKKKHSARAGAAEPKPSRTATAARVAHEVEAGAAGALGGAVMGSAAGPPGIIAGAAMGAAAGAVAGATLDIDAREEAARTRALDDAIGVTAGTIGAPNLKHPPPKIGAYSAASTGGGGRDSQPAEGPEQVPD